jgi:hypothetical protein
VEIAMQSPKPRRRLRLPVRQFELGLADDPLAAIAPRWNTLPDPIQQTVTGLITRLLIAHANDRADAVHGSEECRSDER